MANIKREANQVQFTAKVLSFTERPYQRKDGTSTVYREALIQMGNTVCKFPVSESAPLTNYQGAECELLVEFYSFGNDISVKSRIIGVSE